MATDGREPKIEAFQIKAVRRVIVAKSGS